MRIKNIFRYTLLGLCSAPMVVTAQVTLSDKASQKVDLGYGVEQSEFLTTAAATTITAEELRRTSAISLADALYGKLLGLNAYQNTGFKGEKAVVQPLTSVAYRLRVSGISLSSLTGWNDLSTD